MIVIISLDNIIYIGRKIVRRNLPTDKRRKRFLRFSPRYRVIGGRRFRGNLDIAIPDTLDEKSAAGIRPAVSHGSGTVRPVQ